MPQINVPVEIGKRYKDTVKGVFGTAVATCPDADKGHEGLVMVQLKLDPEHVGDLHPPTFPKAADMRWYHEERLEPADTVPVAEE